MFNKKLKQELQKYREAYLAQREENKKLLILITKQEEEMNRLQQFDKRMLEKIEELCKPKIDNFFSYAVGSGIAVSSHVFESKINILNKSYESLQELLESQAKNIERLNEREEDTKKILFLSGKVEELLRKLNEVKSVKNKK